MFGQQHPRDHSPSDRLINEVDPLRKKRSWRCQNVAKRLVPPKPVVRSNHVMVNKLRESCGVQPLERSLELDEFARHHVEYMAKKLRLVHSVEDSEDLQKLLQSQQVGENIQRGKSVHEMHESTVQSRSMQYSNLVSSQFTQFGMATACGADGKLYLCQVFRCL